MGSEKEKGTSGMQPQSTQKVNINQDKTDFIIIII